MLSGRSSREVEEAVTLSQSIRMLIEILGKSSLEPRAILMRVPWEEARRARKARDPGAPSVADWEAHQATHLPFRVWCQECVRGRRDNPPHRSVPAEVREVPEVGMDYCFLRRAESDDKITVLLQKDRDSRAIRTQVLESKGVACEEAVEAALRVINEFGYRGKIILKADGEPALKALREQVLRRMDGGGLAAQPVAHEHESNGSVENGVKRKGLFRVYLIALEKKISSHIPIDHPILSWLVEFVGDILTKYLQGADGKTAYERLFGKKIREEHLEFGEVVLWRKPRGQDYNVIAEARWESGVWVGRKWGTPHHLVSLGNRVVECRAIQRVPLADRWKSELVDAVRATNPAPVAGAAAPAVLPGPAEPPPAAPRGYVPGSVYIRADDLRRFGRTAGCRRCTLMTNGEAARGVPHTTACRDRFEQAMVEANDDRVQAATDRRDRYRDGQAVALAEATSPMWLRPVPFLTETLKEEQREEEGKMKNLLGDQHVRTAHGDVEDHGDGDGAMQVETEVVDSTGLRSKARPQQSY